MAYWDKKKGYYAPFLISIILLSKTAKATYLQRILDTIIITENKEVFSQKFNSILLVLTASNAGIVIIKHIFYIANYESQAKKFNFRNSFKVTFCPLMLRVLAKLLLFFFFLLSTLCIPVQVYYSRCWKKMCNLPGTASGRNKKLLFIITDITYRSMYYQN